MNSYLILQAALVVGVLVLIGAMVCVLAQLYRTLKILEDMLGNVNRELPAILGKLQIALDGVNSELGRVERIAASFHDVGAKVQTATGLVQRAVASPVIRLAGLAAGVGTALADFVGRKRTVEKDVS